MSFFAWIDFDQNDRDRMRRIMDLFDNEDSRDELGLGSVRDSLADLMFPGTSTIQTRLRYMLFVPWIYRMAGEQSGTAVKRRDIARALEFRLVESLVRGGETRNVIGSAARERLKRLPSDVYWAGLLRLGIRQFQGSRSACLEGTTGEVATLWAAGLPKQPEDFLTSGNSTATFALTTDEAGFFRDRLTQEAPGSLFTWLARQDSTSNCGMIWQHPLRGDWPGPISVLVDHARQFSLLMHGASLLYNLMLSERAAGMQGMLDSVWHQRVEDYGARLQKWAVEMSAEHFSEWDLDDLWQLSRDTTHNVKQQTCRFIESWRDATIRTNGRVAEDEQARALIRDREQRLKGVKSRFRNDGLLKDWSGASGTTPLNYRWKPVVVDHLKDIINAG